LNAAFENRFWAESGLSNLPTGEVVAIIAIRVKLVYVFVWLFSAV
jgi:hypothetical protein